MTPVSVSAPHDTSDATASIGAPEARFKPTAKSPHTAVEIERLYLENGYTEEEYEYKHLLPSFPDVKWEPLGDIPYEDVALRADPSYRNLLKYVGSIEHLTPTFGSVFYDSDLTQLDDAARDELALYIARRGVVFFRGQKNLGVKEQLALGRHWGPLHRHATTGLPRGAAEDPDLLDVHVVYAGKNRIPFAAYTQTDLWHSDVSYERQPPSYTSLKVLDGPPSGGDTLWSSGYGLYDSLSPPLQAYLSKLTATHSAVEQADGARRAGNTVRREAVVSEHPIVRTSPVTGLNAVFVNPGFTRKIVGVPKAESDAILKLLFNEIATNVTHTVRWKWQKDDVAIWDNRVTTHAASFGFYPHQRHAIRVTTHAEKPYFDENGKSQLDTLQEELGIPLLHKDASRPPIYND